MRSRRPTRRPSDGPRVLRTVRSLLREFAQTLLCALFLAGIAALPTPARATPGQAQRLGGPEAQGPATRSLTALHHNPAMLAGMKGLRFQIGGAGGMDQRWIRRYGVDPSGEPTGQLGPRTSGRVR